MIVVVVQLNGFGRRRTGLRNGLEHLIKSQKIDKNGKHAYRNDVV